MRNIDILEYIPILKLHLERGRIFPFKKYKFRTTFPVKFFENFESKTLKFSDYFYKIKRTWVMLPVRIPQITRKRKLRWRYITNLSINRNFPVFKSPQPNSSKLFNITSHKRDLSSCSNNIEHPIMNNKHRNTRSREKKRNKFISNTYLPQITLGDCLEDKTSPHSLQLRKIKSNKFRKENTHIISKNQVI